MQHIFSTETFSTEHKSLFLAGPTPRDASAQTWRPDALALLEKHGFTGNVMIPEDRGWKLRASFDHTEQVKWERDALRQSDVVLFWVPRDIKTMPGFTTNIEFGFVSERRQTFVLGYPHDAPKMAYFKFVADECNAPVCHTLEDTITAALGLLG